MGRDDFRLFLIVFLFALSFCGQPDLQDALIDHFQSEASAQDSREG